jgi:hypothetical protein
MAVGGRLSLPHDIPTATVCPVPSDSSSVQREIDLELLLVVAYPVLTAIDTCRRGLSQWHSRRDVRGRLCRPRDGRPHQFTHVQADMAPWRRTHIESTHLGASLQHELFVSLFFQLSAGACTLPLGAQCGMSATLGA